MKQEQREQILVKAMSGEEIKSLSWLRRRSTKRNAMSTSGRRGTYLHTTTRQGMFGNRGGDGQWQPNRDGRPRAVEKFTAQQRHSSTRAKRARADRAAKAVSRDA